MAPHGHQQFSNNGEQIVARTTAWNVKHSLKCRSSDGWGTAKVLRAILSMATLGGLSRKKLRFL
jgi:hypothetical protein